jgi:small subunit ribosomal protein S1
VDPAERKIALSIKSLQTALDKAELASYMESQGEATSNLGELLKEGLKKNEEQ